MAHRLFHLTIKAAGEHKYYGSLAAIFLDNKDLGVSKFTLDRFDFDQGMFDNDICVIRKGWMYSTGDIREGKSGDGNDNNSATSQKSI